MPYRAFGPGCHVRQLLEALSLNDLSPILKCRYFGQCDYWYLYGNSHNLLYLV